MCEGDGEPSLRQRGNDAFKKGDYLRAAATYTRAIKEDPENAVLYSNRCAALLKLSKVQKALADAEVCIKLRPEWEKGYFRKAAVMEALEKFPEALEWYRKAAEYNPNSTEVAMKIRNVCRLVKASERNSNASASKNANNASGS
eukprot:evm.model.scf_1013.2 EVM.evm.TU.scf_1013.2   scf_1013:16807-22244(+)